MKNLRAGDITVKYDPGTLRQICYGSIEIVRMIYISLRDHNWTTIPYRIANEVIRQGDNSFEIDFELHHKSTADLIHWSVQIRGFEDGSINFNVKGIVRNEFQRNRAGLCILHPLKETIGVKCTITHPDNSVTESTFPDHIAPHSPFKNVASMHWAVNENVFRLNFEGDIFETEDQRNWSDASFKTFCTPSSLPIPVKLKEGTEIKQQLSLTPLTLKQHTPAPADIILTSSTQRLTIPLLGIGASSEIPSLSVDAIDLLRELNLHHYRIDVFPSHEHWVSDFSHNYQQAFSIGLPLEIVLHVTEDFRDEADAFVQLCLHNRVRVYKIVILSEGKSVTSEEAIAYIHQLKGYLPKVLFGAGTDFNFKDINRKRFVDRSFDFVSYSIHPQEHAFDDHTIIENLEAQAHTVKSARHLFEGRQIHISPVTLKKRFNPAAAKESDIVKTNAERSDPRQITRFASTWTFGSICALACANADAVTYFQTCGNQGIMSADDHPYPVYNAMKSFGRLQGKSGFMLNSNKPLEVQGFTLPNAGVTGFVNYTHKSQDIKFEKSSIQLNPLEIRFDFSDGAQ
jgi:hypothetical protein